MAQLVKCLLDKHEDPSLILGWIPAGEAETVESWKLSSQLEFQNTKYGWILRNDI